MIWKDNDTFVRDTRVQVSLFCMYCVCMQYWVYTQVTNNDNSRKARNPILFFELDPLCI